MIRVPAGGEPLKAMLQMLAALPKNFQEIRVAADVDENGLISLNEACCAFLPLNTSKLWLCAPLIRYRSIGSPQEGSQTAHECTAGYIVYPLAM